MLRRRLLLFSNRFSPNQLSGLSLWLKADSLALNDGDNVATWPDSSGNGIDVTQGTATKRPVFKLNQRGGQPVVRFDGVDDQLISASVLGSQLFAAQAVTVFVVQKQTGTQATNTVFLWLGSSSPLSRFMLLASYNDELIFEEGELALAHQASSQPPGWDDAWHFVTAQRNGTASDIRVDGASIGTAAMSGDALVGSSALLYIGTTNTGSAPYLGDIAEIIVYKRALPAEEITRVEGYLRRKYTL